MKWGTRQYGLLSAWDATVPPWYVVKLQRIALALGLSSRMVAENIQYMPSPPLIPLPICWKLNPCCPKHWMNVHKPLRIVG